MQIFHEYALRFDIEESFFDDPSNGWNIQKSEIRDVCALSRPWFLLAIATLDVTALIAKLKSSSELSFGK
jgi:hypothetical protein